MAGPRRGRKKHRSDGIAPLMALIKHAKAERMVKSAIVLDLGDLQLQADRIIDQARQQAEPIVSEAEQRAARIDAIAGEKGHADGQAQGFHEGRAQGRQEGRAEVISELKPRLNEIADRWSAALEQWETDRKEMFLSARSDVLRFALAMAEKVVGRIIEVDPSVIERQLAEALLLISRPTSVVVTINPEDRSVVQMVLDEPLARIGLCEHVQLREDPFLTRGGCLVTTAGGSIDASIETQVRRIAEALLPAADQPAPAEAADGESERAGDK